MKVRILLCRDQVVDQEVAASAVALAEADLAAEAAVVLEVARTEALEADLTDTTDITDTTDPSSGAVLDITAVEAVSEAFWE